MPLITITTPRHRCPSSAQALDSELQALTAQFGNELPQIIVDNCLELALEPGDTPIQGVQVDFRRFHWRAVNIPEIWIHVQFAEEPPRPHAPWWRRIINFLCFWEPSLPVPDSEMLRIRDKLRELIDIWFSANSSQTPDIAMDIFWGPDHGFLLMRDVEAEW